MRISVIGAGVAGLTAACWLASPRPVGWRGLALIAVLDLGIFVQAILAVSA